MTSGDSNPYAVPETPTPSDFPKEPSLLRGMAYALPLGLVGFSVMSVSIFVSAFYRNSALQYPQRRADAYDDFQELYFGPSITCSLIFAFAATLNFTPKAQIGLFRALIYTSGYAIIALITTFIASIALDLGPRGYSVDPWAWHESQLRLGFYSHSLEFILQGCVVERSSMLNKEKPSKKLNRSSRRCVHTWPVNRGKPFNFGVRCQSLEPSQ